MKKLYLLLCLIILASCTGVETPVFSNDLYIKNKNLNVRPFVVHNIERVDENNCRYTSNNENEFFAEAFSRKPSFIAKTGLFVIGDTVKVGKK